MESEASQVILPLFSMVALFTFSIKRARKILQVNRFKEKKGERKHENERESRYQW